MFKWGQTELTPTWRCWCIDSGTPAAIHNSPCWMRYEYTRLYGPAGFVTVVWLSLIIEGDQREGNFCNTELNCCVRVLFVAGFYNTQESSHHLSDGKRCLPSEGILSRLSNIVTDKRNRLYPGKMRILGILKPWGSLRDEVCILADSGQGYAVGIFKIALMMPKSEEVSESESCQDRVFYDSCYSILPSVFVERG
ncbi:hypothetical protein JCM33374_g6278 [Metschnikowia sp. JCM 33374]|nr:hypothetical protein JCM33374_g6278 [Metschnikowia sp. JCM 33374]